MIFIDKMAIIVEPERSKLYRRIKALLGAPVRGVELEDEQMDSLLELAIGDYEQYILDWLIEAQWTSLYGLNLDEQSLTRALTKRSLDWETQYTYAYSKIVGLQAGGDWVLKKDYVDLVRNQQIYEIPAGREINELLWFMRAELNNSLFDPFMGGFGGFGGTGLGGPGGYAQFGASGSYFMMPAFDVVLRMADRNLKQRLIVGDLTYRITALPEGKKALHLYNVPGGKFDFSNIGFNEYRCWYWYYDINPLIKDDCLAKNKDIIKSPADVPLDDISFDDLNDPAKVWIRRYFIALCKETLGRVRGTFGGKIPVPDANMEIEYQSLLSEGKDEMVTLKKELEDRMFKLNPLEILKRMSTEAEEINKALKYRAFQKPIKII